MQDKRKFPYDKVLTLKIGREFSNDLINKYADIHKITTYEARCQVAETYIEKVMDKITLKEFGKTMKKHDDIGYTYDDFCMMIDEINKGDDE